jgi:hypothetical protein
MPARLTRRRNARFPLGPFYVAASVKAPGLGHTNPLRMRHVV